MLAGTLGAALLVVLPASAGAAPKTTTCNGGLAPGTYQKVVVPEGGTCLSDGPVRINGGLSVSPGATFVLGNEENPGHTGTISGGIAVHGGSGPFGGPFDVTWNAIEDNRINGGATIDGYDGFWFGFIRNTVNGTVNLNDNVLADPDGNEYVTNRIHGNLNCAGNSPAPQVGDSEGSPNQVTGRKTGQCAAV